MLRSEPAEVEVKTLFYRGECVTPATCLGEVVDQLIRRHGVVPEDIADHLEPLVDASLRIVPIENDLGWQAGQDRGVHYNRNGADLSLADCVLLACAGPDDELASSDGTLLRVARALDIGTIPLLDSYGRRPG